MYCGAIESVLGYHPTRLEGDIPICVACYGPMRDALLWQIEEESRVNEEYSDLKQWVAECARPEVLAALRAKLYEMGVRLSKP